MTIARFATPQPSICAVCRRSAVWLGYAPSKQDRPPVIWLCDDNRCHAAGKKIYSMPGKILNAYELGAMLEAGALAGNYLEQLGTTDITYLSPAEWREFLRRLLTGYEDALRRKILNDEPGFGD